MYISKNQFERLQTLERFMQENWVRSDMCLQFQNILKEVAEEDDQRRTSIISSPRCTEG